jgi:tRNA-2-methylthio-N6-dimethylallyladenosine synthase
LRRVRYKVVYVFKYSPRPATVSAKRDADDVPDAVKRVRNNRMLELQQQISREHHEALLGTTVEVLVEGAAKVDPAARDAELEHTEDAPRDEGGAVLLQLGKKKRARPVLDRSSSHIVRLTSRTRGDHIVAFDGPESLVGTLAHVKLVRATGLSLNGELVTGLA